MFKFNLKKQYAVIVTIFILTIILPPTSSAQTITDTCASETTKKQTDCTPPTAVANQSPAQKEAADLALRQRCDAATLALDQCHLKTIREKDSLSNDDQEAAKSCISTYKPADNGSQSGIMAGQYVPVHETGQLLTLTQSTNALTTDIDEYVGKSYNMDIQICLYLHAIKRVQYAMEDLTFVKEPDMRRQATTKIEEYKKGLLGTGGLIKTGYNPSGKLAEPVSAENQITNKTLSKSTLYPENLNSHLADAREEGYGLFMDNYTNYSSNEFKDIVSAQLKTDETLGNSVTIDSNIPKEIYNNFVSSNGSKLSDGDWWGTFNSIFDITRPNNPYTSYMYAKEELDAQKSQSEELAKMEYLANDGFLPVRTCISYTADGLYCRVWKTITPGKVVGNSANTALDSKLKQYENPELGQVGEGNEPSTNEVGTFNPSTGSGGGNWGQGTGTNDNGNGYEIPTIPPINVELPIPAPTLAFFVTDKLDSTREIMWITRNVSSCKTDNDWIGTMSPENKLISVIKTKGSSLSTSEVSNSTSFSLPLEFIASWSKNGLPYDQAGMSSTTNTTKTGIVYTWNIPQPKKNTDIYYLNLRDGITPEGTSIGIGGVNFPIAPLTASQVVTLFKNYETNNPNASVYRNYKFTYNPTATTPNIQIERIYLNDLVKRQEPRYKITCTGKDGSKISDSAD